MHLVSSYPPAFQLSSASLTIQRPADLSAILFSDIVLLNSKRSFDFRRLTYRQLLSAPMNIRRPGHTALSLTTLRPFGDLARF